MEPVLVARHVLCISTFEYGWNSGMRGWKEEAPLYDRTFQPYGQIFIMNADGSDKRQLTDSLWEDSTPRYVPKPQTR